MIKTLSLIVAVCFSIVAPIALFLVDSAAQDRASESSEHPAPPAEVVPAHHIDGVDPALCDIAELARQGKDWHSQAAQRGITVNTEGDRVLAQIDANLRTNVYNCSVKLREPYRYSAETLADMRAAFSNLTYVDMGVETRFRAWVAPLDIPALQQFLIATQPENVINAYYPNALCYGSVNSEGPNAMGVSSYPAPIPSGSGVKVGIVDNGFVGASTTAAAEVGTFTSPQGAITSGTEVHGTACAEIVRDAAPSCQMRLYALPLGMTDVQAVQDCITNGVQVISRSLGGHGYPGEGDDCDAARLAKLNGIIYCNSAGNYGDRKYWERQNPAINGSLFAEASPGVALNQIATGSATSIWISYTNEQPTGSYARFQAIIYEDAGSGPVAVAQGTAGSTLQSVQYNSVISTRSYYVGIKRTQAGTVGRMRYFLYSSGTLTYRSSVGSIPNPAVLDTEVITVGAVNYSSYTASGSPTSYSSRGGGIWNLPLDFCAPTACSTITYGTSGFSGTSCSCPNTAGLMALQLSHASFASDPINTLTLVNLGVAGWDVDSGWGIVKVPTSSGGTGLTVYQDIPAAVPNTPTNLTITPQTYFWNAVGVSSPASSNWNLAMGTGSTSGAAGVCDFLVANGNMGSVSNTGSATRTSGSAAGTAEHAGLSSLQPGGSEVFLFNGTHVLHLWEVFIQTAGTYPVTVSGTSNTDFKWYLFSPGSDGAWKSAASANYGPFTPSATAQNLSFSSTGYWALVVALNNGPGSADVINVGVGNPLQIPTITISTSALNLGTTSTGIAGVTQTYTVGGTFLTDNITLNAPLTVELSTTGQAGTFTPQLVLLRSGTTVLTTTIHARIAASAAQGSISGVIAHTSSGATTRNVTLSGTVLPPSVPAINVSPSALDLGATTQGSAGAAYGYTVSGTNLAADISITPPAGVEVSLSQSSGYTTSLNVARSGTSVPNTTIYARISAAAVTGAIGANITHASSGATTKNVAVTGTVVMSGSALITVSVTSLDLGATALSLGSGTSFYYIVEASGLTQDVQVTAPAGVRIETNNGNVWFTSLTINRVGSSIPTTRLKARLGGGSIATFSGNITHASVGAVTKTVSVTGEVKPDTAPLVLPWQNAGQAPLDLGSTTQGTAGATYIDYNLYLRNLSGTTTVTAPEGVEMSDSLQPNSWVRMKQFNVTQLNGGLYVRLSNDAPPGLLQAMIAHSTAGLPTAYVPVQGSVTAATGPTIMVNRTAVTPNGTSENIAGPSTFFDVSAVLLSGDLTITAPAGAELSLTDAIGSYTPSIIIVPVSGTVTRRTIYVRLAAQATTGSTKPVVGNIAHASAGAITRNVGINDNVYPGPGNSIVASMTALNMGTSEWGVVSAVQTFNVHTYPGQRDVYILASNDVEVATQLTGTYSELAQVYSTTPRTIYVRKKKFVPVGLFSSYIRVVGQFMDEKRVLVEGEVVAATSPAIELSVPKITVPSTTQGVAGAAVGYTVRGGGLSADIVITAPTGMELSSTGVGGTYANSIMLTHSSGVVADTVVFVRVSATAPLGQMSGTIVHASTGATSVLLTASWGRVVVSTAVYATADDAFVDVGRTVAAEPGGPVPFVISAFNIPTSASFSVSPNSSRMEVSLDGVTGWASNKYVPVTGPSLVNQVVFIRLKWSNPTSNFYGLDESQIRIECNSSLIYTIDCSGWFDRPPSPALNLTAPAGSESWQAGTSQQITWTNVNGYKDNVDLELSNDSGQTWFAVILRNTSTLPQSYTWNIPSTVPPGTTYRIRIRDNGDSISSMSGANFTITAAAPPLVQSSLPSLNLGSTIQGTPGTPQTYVASGDNLGTIPITVTPPLGVEIRNASASGTFSNNAVLLMPSNGSVPATNIEVRIAASASIGQPFNDLVQTSGLGTLNITLSGTVNPPPPGISVFPGSLNLGTTTQGVAGAAQSWQVTGANLTANITVTPPSGVEIRNTAGGTFSASALDLVPVSGSVSATLEARIAASATAAQSFGDITHVSASANEVVTLLGTVLPPPSLNATPNSINLGTTTTGTAGSTLGAYTISGSNLAAAVTVTPPAGVEIRDTSGGTFSASPLILNPSAGSVNVNIEARIAATAAASQSFGDITHVSGSANENVTVSGSVLAQPSLNTTPGSVDLGTTVEGTAGATIDSYAITGSNLQANVTVTPPAGVEIRDAAGGTFASTPLVFVPASGSVSVTIEARIAASATAGQTFGAIANSSGSVGASVTVNGTVSAPVPVINTTQSSLNLGTTIQGVAGATFSYSVNGSNLTSAVTITPPAGVEIRDLPAGTFGTSALILTPTSGTLASTTIEVRIAASAISGQAFGAISHTSGTATASVTLSGTVNSPDIVLLPGTLNLGTVTEGAAGAAFSYDVSGSNLLAAVTITPPAGVEIRQTPAGTFGSSPIVLAPTSGTLAATTIEVRISATALAGQVFAPITHVSGSASSSLSLSGSVLSPSGGSGKKGGSDSGGCTTTTDRGALLLTLALTLFVWSRRRRRQVS